MPMPAPTMARPMTNVAKLGAVTAMSAKYARPAVEMAKPVMRTGLGPSLSMSLPPTGVVTNEVSPMART